MAYGQLDVFFPDGVMTSYTLTEDNISIGRSAGNSIALETDTISRYHLSITHTADGVFVTDLESQNGTFIDGARLKQNEPYPLHGGAEILIGELILIYNEADASPTRPIVVPEETQQAARVDATFRIELEQPDIAVPPGAHTSARLTITNLLEVPQKLAISAAGLPADWLRVSPPQVEVSPEASITVVISVKPLRRAESRPGDYRLDVSVLPRDADPEAAEAARLTVTTPIRILAFSGFGYVLEPRHVRPGDPFRLHMHNQGNAPLPIALGFHAASTEEGPPNAKNSVLQVAFSQPALTFAPGQRVTVTGTARPTSTPLFGDPYTLTVDLTARSGDAAGFTLAQRVHLSVKPPLPRWALYAVASGVVMGVLALVLAVIAFVSAPVTPVIESFTAREGRITQGTPIALDWEVRGAQSVGLRAAGIPAGDMIDPAAGYAQISTENISGVITVELQAINGDRIVQAETVVEVVVPLAITGFTVEPSPLVRYVAQVVTLRWSAVGAVRTAISGLEQITTAPVNASYGAAGELTFNTIPAQAAYTLTLSAANSAGELISVPFTITTLDPECTADRELTLHAGPDAGGQVISTAPAGTRVVVDARDIGGGWLRVAGGRGWGERDAFACDATFNPDDLLQALAVPTVVPSPAATATPGG